MIFPSGAYPDPLTLLDQSMFTIIDWHYCAHMFTPLFIAIYYLTVGKNKQPAGGVKWFQSQGQDLDSQNPKVGAGKPALYLCLV